jgi:hypothetical protein
MIKRIVVANNFTQYATYVRNRKWTRSDAGFYIAGEPIICLGLPRDTPVHWLEGWSDDSKINNADIDFLKHRFTTHKEISEEKIHYEGIMF